jgi:hypothetical protein
MGRLKCNFRTHSHTQSKQLPHTNYTKIEEKRRLRRNWTRLSTQDSKRLLTTATEELKQLSNNNKNDHIQTFLQGLAPTESTNYSLWKVTKKIKRGHQIFSTNQDNMRNLGKKKFRKSICLRQALSTSLRAPPH